MRVSWDIGMEKEDGELVMGIYLFSYDPLAVTL